jgi:hypothetical protein
VEERVRVRDRELGLYECIGLRCLKVSGARQVECKGGGKAGRV